MERTEDVHKALLDKGR